MRPPKRGGSCQARPPQVSAWAGREDPVGRRGRRGGGGGAEAAGGVVEDDLRHVLCVAAGRGKRLRRAPLRPPPRPPMYSAPGPEACESARRRRCRWTSTVCGARRLSAASFLGCGEGGREGQRLWPCGGDGGEWLFPVDGEILEANGKWVCAYRDW